MHDRGLKLGIYTDMGTETCGGYPGTLDYITIDAQTFVDWDLDSVKMGESHCIALHYDTAHLEYMRPV